MSRRLLGVCGVAVVLGAAAWASVGGPAAAVVTLVIIGTVLAAADAVVWDAEAGPDGSGGSDLAVPAGRRLRSPPWGLTVGAAAGLGVLASVLAGAPWAAAAFGLVLVLAGAVLLRPAPEREVPARVAFTARRLRSFARAHGVGPGEPASGYLTPVGESGVRMFVVAPDGRWADAMVGATDAAELARLARIELGDPNDPATGRQVRVDADLWTAMTRSW
ncbi:MAG TPA: hypothetical protein VFR13_04205 [Jiangellaceae bacterium]|nr:hypothetical protein [Jiangellaceae bacterium]